MALTGYIGVSCAEQARTSDFWESFIGLDCPDGTVVKVARSANIAANRNGHTTRMLACGAEWIFYVDDDHIFSPDTLQRLLAHQVDVVSGLYLHRDAPFLPQVLENAPGGLYTRTLLNPGDHGLVERQAVGSGCLLVRRRVIEALSPPYWTLGQVTKDEWGDDLDFCRRVRAAGFAIHVDLDAAVGHKILGTIWPERTPEGWMTTLVLRDVPVAAFPQPSNVRIARPDQPLAFQR